jgi:hypothetical protein
LVAERRFLCLRVCMRSYTVFKGWIMICRLHRLAAVAAALATTIIFAACAAGSQVPSLSRITPSTAFQVRPHSVGGGLYTAQAPPGHPISKVIASFPFVTGVRSVKNTPTSSSGCGANCFEITLTTTTFTPSSCGNLTSCTGSQQFVYENPGSGSGTMWIANYLEAPNSSTKNCPSGWTVSGYYCRRYTTYSGKIPNVPMTSANLKSISLTASAAKSGDKLILNIGSARYVVAQKDLTGLAGQWSGLQFDIAGGGGTARFNARSTITFALQMDTGVQQAPACLLDGSSSSSAVVSSNNLTLVLERPTPSTLTFPSVWFTASNVPGHGSSSCITVGAKPRGLKTQEGV